MTMKKILLILSVTAFAGTGLAQQAFAARDFVWYCSSPEATASQKNTVNEIYKAAKLDRDKVSCEDAQKKLNETKSLFLRFADTRIEDFAPLEGLTSLKYLTCDKQCDDKALATFPLVRSLTSLYIPRNGLAKVPDITRFPSLDTLGLRGNPIAGIRNINQLKRLKVLDVGITKIKDLAFLSQLPKLSRVDVAKLPEGALETLPQLDKLNYISFAYNTLNDLAILDKVPNVEQLFLYNTTLKSLEGIDRLKKLRILSIDDNGIAYIPRGLIPTTVVRLFASDNPLESHEFLLDLSELQSLNINGTGFSDWAFLDHLRPKIEYLNLAANPLRAKYIPEGQTEKWPELTGLWLEGTKITSLEFFKRIEAPNLKDRFTGPAIANKTEQNCPMKGVPAGVAAFCSK